METRIDKYTKVEKSIFGDDLPAEYFFKIQLIGGNNSGKSNLLYTYLDNEYSGRKFFWTPEHPTGIGFNITFLNHEDHTKIKLQIFNSMNRNGLDAKNKGSSADVIMVILDLTNQNSFYEVQENLNTCFANKHASLDAAIVLVGTKADGARKITSDQINTFLNASQYKIKAYVETSAKNLNVDKAFFTAVDCAFARLELLQKRAYTGAEKAIKELKEVVDVYKPDLEKLKDEDKSNGLNQESSLILKLEQIFQLNDNSLEKYAAIHHYLNQPATKIILDHLKEHSESNIFWKITDKIKAFTNLGESTWEMKSAKIEYQLRHFQQEKIEDPKVIKYKEGKEARLGFK